MSDKPRGILFRKRNVLGVALVIGVGCGIYLGQFKFGTGGSGMFGFGKLSQDSRSDLDADLEIGNVEDSQNVEATKLIRVLIDEHQFLLRKENQDVPARLSEIVALIEKTQGDEDGIRVRVYETLNARVLAEEQLKKALKTAGIPDTAVLWVPPVSPK